MLKVMYMNCTVDLESYYCGIHCYHKVFLVLKRYILFKNRIRNFNFHDFKIKLTVEQIAVGFALFSFLLCLGSSFVLKSYSIQ